MTRHPVAAVLPLVLAVLGGCNKGDKGKESGAASSSVAVPSSSSASVGVSSATTTVAPSTSEVPAGELATTTADAFPPPQHTAPPPPPYSLSVLPLGNFDVPVAAKIIPVESVPANFDPDTSKIAPWVDVRKKNVVDDGTLTTFDFRYRSAWALELRRKAVRVGLWSHVHRWKIDDGGEHLLIARTIADAKGEIFYQHAIIDLKTGAEHPLPTAECTHDVLLRDGRAIGYGLHDENSDEDSVPTSICAFELDGKPVARLLANLNWEYMRGPFLDSTIGFLADGVTFFVVREVWDEKESAVYAFTIDITDPTRKGIIADCPYFEPGTFTFANPTYKMKGSNKVEHVVKAKVLLAPKAN